MDDYIEYTVWVFKNGDKHWFGKTGHNHREDGPAMEYANGEKRWFIYGHEYTEAEFNNRANAKKNPCNGKIVEIDGKKYKLTAI